MSKKSKRTVEVSGFDGSFLTIEISADYSKKKWQEGKCWATWCVNPFFYIHFNRNGKATHAYCLHQWGQLEMCQYGEKWGHIEKGKLVIDAEKTKGDRK